MIKLSKVLVALMMVLLPLVATPSASASSSYDNTIQPTDKLYLASSTLSCSAKNFNTSWSEIMLDTDSWGSWGQYLLGADASSTIAAFNSALSNGGSWAVSQGNFVPGSSNGGGGAVFDDTISVQFSTSPTAYVDFSTFGSNTYAHMFTTDGGYVYNVRLSFIKPSSGPNAGICIPVVNQTARWVGDKSVSWLYNNLGDQQFTIATDWQPQDMNFVTTAHPLFINADINYPSNYEGVVASSTYTPPTAGYVAMGDSYSSGEGNPTYESGTDNNGVNECHRSPFSYPRILDSDVMLNLGTANFVACSGATTVDMQNGSYNEPSQLEALSNVTEVVTITAGGNDVGFKDFATACTVGLCNFSTSAYGTIISKITNDLPSLLDALYTSIAAKIPATAEVYVVGYPHIAPPIMPTTPCWPLNGQLDDPDPALNDGATVRYVVDALNDEIASAVSAMNDARFMYVDPNQTGSPFIGHDWCEDDRFFNIVTLNNIEHSFHPNGNGQAAYAAIVSDAMN